MARLNLSAYGPSRGTILRLRRRLEQVLELVSTRNTHYRRSILTLLATASILASCSSGNSDAQKKGGAGGRGELSAALLLLLAFNNRVS